MSLPRERPFFPPQLSVRVWRKWDSERAADRRHLKSACCWLDRDKPGKTQNLRCSAARKPRSSLWGADGNIVRCWLAARYSQQCIQIKCFSKDCKPFLSYRRKKKNRSAIGPQTIGQHKRCQALIPFWKWVAMPPKHFPFCVHFGCIVYWKKYETEESGRRAVSLGGRTRAAREETHAPLLSLRESFFSFVSRRVAHTGDWLLTGYKHSHDRVPNNERLK